MRGQTDGESNTPVPILRRSQDAECDPEDGQGEHTAAAVDHVEVIGLVLLLLANPFGLSDSP